MNALNYWDLPEKDRGLLTREEVEQFEAFELMSKGVLRVAPPKLEDEPSLELPKRTVYRIRTAKRSYDVLDVAFRTAEEAQTFLDLIPLWVRSIWNGSESVYSVDGMASPEVVTEELYEHHAVEARRHELDKVTAIRASNEKARREYAESIARQRHAVQGLWDDWRRCRDIDARMRLIVGTFDEYKTIARDDVEIASRCLLKVFGRDEVERAAEWCCVDIPVVFEQRNAPEPAAELPL